MDQEHDLSPIPEIVIDLGDLDEIASPDVDVPQLFPGNLGFPDPLGKISPELIPNSSDD